MVFSFPSLLYQERLVREGYAEVKYVYDDYLYSSKLKEIEKETKSLSIGMWAGGAIDSDFDFNAWIISGISALIASFVVFIKKFIKRFVN